jgi:uncharacterized protein (DUF2141 family)
MIKKAIIHINNNKTDIVSGVYLKNEKHLIINKIRYLIALMIFIVPIRFAVATPSFSLGNLEVEIDNIHSDNGTVRVHIYNDELKDNFPKQTQNCYRCMVGKIKDHKSIIIFDNLPYDSYCLSVHHDENENVKMDLTLLGFPAEGWGISNNVQLFLRLPEFDECSFKIDKRKIKINVDMRY